MKVTKKLATWARRLEDAAWSIQNDGTSSQVGLSEGECRELAAFLQSVSAMLELPK